MRVEIDHHGQDAMSRSLESSGFGQTVWLHHKAVRAAGTADEKLKRRPDSSLLHTVEQA
jgi:hypothetical protein